MYCFLCLPIPDSVSQKLAEWQLAHPKVAWQDFEAYHLTLAYLGDVSVPDLQDLDEQLAELRFGAMELEIRGVGSFHDSRRTRALIADFFESQALTDLRKRVVRICEPLVPNLGHRKFKPHVTLAKTQGLYLDETAALIEDLSQEKGGLGPLRFKCEGFELWQSQHTKSGVHYQAVASYPAWDAIFSGDSQNVI